MTLSLTCQCPHCGGRDDYSISDIADAGLEFVECECGCSFTIEIDVSFEISDIIKPIEVNDEEDDDDEDDD